MRMYYVLLGAILEDFTPIGPVTHVKDFAEDRLDDSTVW